MMALLGIMNTIPAVQRLGLVLSLEQMAHFGKADGISGTYCYRGSLCVVAKLEYTSPTTHFLDHSK